MTEEYIYQRERELLDYFRNNMEDPNTMRGTTITDEEHTAVAGQTEFVLANNYVKNVADTITVNTTIMRKGLHYDVTYGEGANSTTVVFKESLLAADKVYITYYYGTSMIEREFSRSDSKLPRIVISFLTGEEEFAALGDSIEGGKGYYFNVSYRIEVRDEFANRARIIASKAFNLCQKMRHANLFRTNVTKAGSLQNFDYDVEKEAYIWQFTLDIQWEVMFE